jgi:plastocyanin
LKAWILLFISIPLAIALINNSLLVAQASNSTMILLPKSSEDFTHQDRVIIKLTPSGTTAEGNVSPKNVKVKVGTTVVWENMLPEKVYVQSKPDENHYQGELLNGSYFFPGESREEKLNKNGTFIYDGSNGFGSYYVRGTITVVENATEEKTAPIENIDNQKQFMTSNDTGAALQTYSNTKLGISLKHPTDWKPAYLKNGIQFIKEMNGVYLEIRKHNLESPHVELKQYVGDSIKDRSSSRVDFKLLNITNTTISGNLPAYKAIYTFLKTENQKDFATEETTNKISRTWTFAQNNAYLVAYVADEDNYGLYLPIAEKIIDTLKINPESQESFSDSDSSDKNKDNNSNDNDSNDKNKDNNSNDKNKDNNSNDKNKDNNSNDKNKDNNSNDKDNNDYKDKDGDGDIDCDDVDKKNFKVEPGDPGNLDGDGDGIGCEG